MPGTMVFALLVVGATGMTAQIVLMRELLTVFLGNELSLGIILACWLVSEAMGAWLAGRLRPRLALFAASIVVSLLAFPAAIWLARVARPLFGFTPGEVLGPFSMLLIAAYALLPTALLHGALFTSGVSLASPRSPTPTPCPLSPDPRSQIPGRVYVIETLGSVIGGLLLSLLLIGRMGSFQIALAIAALNSVVLLVITRRFTAGFAAGSLLLVGAVAGLLLKLPAALDRSSLARLYPGNQIVYSGDSHYGNVTVLRRAGQSTVLSDGAPTVTLPVPDFGLAEDLVHIPMLSLRAPHRVLLIGGGAAGLLAELLKYPGVRIDYCEPNPALVSVMRRNLPEFESTGLQNPRVTIRTIDGRRYLQGQPAARYDLVIIGLPGPTTLQANRYFSAEFFALARRRLEPDGLLVIMAPGSTAYLSDRLAALNRILFNTLQRPFTSVTAIPGEDDLFLASGTDRPGSREPETLAARLAEYGFDTRTVTLRHLTERLSVRRRVEFEQRIAPARWHGRASDTGLGECGLRPPAGTVAPATRASGNAECGIVNSDRQPILVMAALSYWAGMSSPATARLLSGLIGGRFRLVLAVIIGLVVALLFWRRRIRFALRFAVFSTGFAGAFASILVLLLFQISSGTLHLHLALLTTAFMAGAALGGAWATWRLQCQPAAGSAVYWLEAGVAGIGLTTLLAGNLLALTDTFGTLTGYGLLALAAGFLLGAEFPLVNRAYLDSSPNRGLARTAGSLYSADLFGGVFSSLLIPVLLIPTLGMLPTALLVLLTKAASVSMLRLSRN